MTTFSLKMLAVIAMLIDHSAEVIFNNNMTMRMIGRLAFPIYAFLIVEGFHKTRNKKKYLIRLALFAIISELPFNLALHKGQLFYLDAQNVFFTLAIGLAMLMALERFKNSIYLSVLIIITACFYAETLHTDYSYRGILVILFFELCRDCPLIRNISIMAVFMKIAYWFNGYASVALIPISFYNEKKGPSCKYFFYCFYPVHLLILYFIAKKTGIY
ncbi:TraX family protein [Lachnospiraceae bacterium C1.1]|nr:TraX family protein [Lachnospiraceae bacterium C1.1]